MKLAVRKADDKTPPEPYQAGMGVILNRSNTEYAPIKSLLEFR
jgi:hypothetical protein